MLGNGLQGTLLGVRASLEGFSTNLTGLIMTGYFIGFLAGSFLIPRAIANVGHIRVFAALASLASIAILVHSVFINTPTWIAMRLLTGFSYAGLYIVVESWINDRATNETRGQLLSIYMLITLGSMAAGQFLLNLSAPDSFELFILISALVSLALVPISLTVVTAPRFETPTRLSIRELYEGSPLGVVGIFASGITAGTLFGMGAVYATAIGLPLEQVAYFMSAILLGGMLLQWPIGWLSDRFDRRLIMTVVVLLASLCAVVAISLSDTPALLVVVAIFGGLNLPIYSLCIAHTNDHLEPEQMVAASASLVMFNGIGASIGPLSTSLMMSFFGPNGFFWWLAALQLSLGLFAIFRMTRRAAIPLEQQGSYVAVSTRSTVVASTMAAEEFIYEQEQDDTEDTNRPAT